MTHQEQGGVARVGDGQVIMPEQNLPLGANIVAGFQHLVAMFGATALGPILMGFDPNVAIFFSGVATLLFYIIMLGKVPSYLGSSFAFIAAVIAATGYAGAGPNPNIAIALGGIIAAGAVYAAIGLVVMFAGHAWIEKLMPAPVTGVIVAIIGLNLAPVAVNQIGHASGGAIGPGIGVLTIILVALTAIYAPGTLKRLPILIGGGLAYLIYFVAANVLGWAQPMDFGGIAAADWFGVPNFQAPQFDARAMLLIAPVALILVAENLGHIKAIGAMTGRNMDKYIGRAFFGDGVATMISGSGGGTGVTTYAENMGVMAVTKNYSSLTFVVAALFAIGFGLSPKFGAAVQTIPLPVLGGLAFVVFGLITATAGRIWVEGKVDFSDSRNLITVGVAAVIGAGDLALNLGGFTLGGIATATLAALILYHALGFGRRSAAHVAAE